MSANLNASHEPESQGSGIWLADLVEDVAVLAMWVIAAVVVASLFALLIII